MIELGALMLFGVVIVAVIVAFAAVMKAIFWIVLLPVRLVFWALGAVLLLPLLLLKLLFGGLMALVAVPFVLLGLIVGAIALIFGVLIPALPLILLAALLWYLVRPEPTRLAGTDAARQKGARQKAKGKPASSPFCLLPSPFQVPATAAAGASRSRADTPPRPAAAWPHPSCAR